MNILHLQLAGDPNGIISLCRDICYNSKNHNFIYILFKGGTVVDELKNKNIDVFVSNSNHYFWWKSKKKLLSYCKDNKIDVIINHSNSPIACSHTLYIKRKIKKIRIIGYLHSDISSHFKTLKQKVLGELFLKRFHRKTFCTIAISSFVKKMGIKYLGINDSKVIVIYNGINLDNYQKCNHTLDDTIEFVYVGRLIKEKGLSLLLDAVDLIPENIKVHFSIVGYGKEYDLLQRKLDKIKFKSRVDFYGLQMDIKPFLAKANYFIHPAIWNEGFGITLVEALSMGLPCISFKRGALDEIITDNINGFLINEVSKEQLANKIIDVVNIGINNYQLLCDNASMSAKRFDIKKTIENLETFYTVSHVY